MPVTHLLKVSRLEGLTDGIFAIAMTILVLNLHVPASDPNLSPLIEHPIYFNLFIFFGSFIILGTHWIAMNFQWGLLDHVNRIYLWANLFYLMVICIVPFSANLLGKYPHRIECVHFYAINLLCTSLGQFLTLQCASFFELFKKEFYLAGIFRASLMRMLIAPIFYLSSLIIAHWHVKVAFFFIVLPTVIYLIPGRIDRYEVAKIQE